MNKYIKILGSLISLIFIVTALIILYINFSYPNIPLDNSFKVEMTEQNIERGKYLVNSVNACFHCHSTVDFTKFSGKIIENEKGKGGRYYPEEGGFPGNFYSSNITPYNLKDWSDAEIYRAITSGVNKNGDALFPLMPYHAYKYLTLDDAKSIIAYLRTIKPIEAKYNKSEFTFPFSLILKTIPNKPEPTDKSSLTNNIEYGKYLVNIGGCEDCHTPSEGGTPDENMRFAGGFEIPMETGGICKAANITPDNETGIGSWTKEKFIQRFKFYQNNDSLIVKSGGFNSEMPWTVYANMTEEDLGSIYEYLRTVKPIKNRIQKFIP
ncbi:MAG: cytochrome C [Ignavibacteriae bacterium]|nr:cytochrome C [Ignavibacteriota bacterium]MCB9258558.1 cytochrome C [Ignavibacteriales bacterium]